MDIPISPKIGAAIIGIVLLVGVALGYHWWKADESYVPQDTWVKIARYCLEKEPRKRLQQEGKSPGDIDTRIAAMWKSGELKLPEGIPGKDWCATPDGGIRMLPKPEDLLRG